MKTRLDDEKHLDRLLRELTPLNRTIVSDDMDRAAAVLEQAMGFPAVRYEYPSGTEYGSWIVPPSWNVQEAFLSDGERVLASYKEHVLFLAPYSAPFEGWISKEELMRHVTTADAFDDAFFYQHRVAYDFHKRLQDWEITLPLKTVASLNRDRYFVKIAVDVRPGKMNVLEYVAEGREKASVAILTHLCHPGQANDGLSGVLAGLVLIQRLTAVPHRFTYKLLVLPETIGSVVHVVAQSLSNNSFVCAVFLETMGRGETLCLKQSRTGNREIDLALAGLVHERPEFQIRDFFDPYGNDELVFDFANVNIPSVGIQYHPFPEYHTSRDSADLIDWHKWKKAIEVVLELFRRLESNRVICLKYPGPPYLSRYRLYADAVNEPLRWAQIARVLALCDGHHSILQICHEVGLPFDQVLAFFDALDREGLLAN